MTRFARAHGSKASNERQPEEATSWSTFKRQLLGHQNAPENTEEDNSRPTTKHRCLIQQEQNTKAEWAKFEDDISHKKDMPIMKKRKLKDSVNMSSERMWCEEVYDKNTNLPKIEKDNLGTAGKNSKKLKKSKREQSGKLECVLKDVEAVLPDKSKVKASKQLKHSKKRKLLEKPDVICNFESFSHKKKTESNDAGEGKYAKKQLKKKQSSRKSQKSGFASTKTNVGSDLLSVQGSGVLNVNTAEPIAPENRKQKKNKQKKRKKEVRDSSLVQQESSVVVDSCTNQSHSTTDKKSKRQKRNLKNARKEFPIRKQRRKQLIQFSSMVINGEETKIAMFDGFPVRAKDAEHLGELHKELTACGLPSADINHTIKLERRKAEKALAREKRKVCFHCRKGGHNLSDCPELNDGSNQDAAGTGICFKCGSTEHTHFQCRVVRGQDFRFAKCFICKEQGHISRQCPDNPRGLYPKGGACKICGDVTHLKKDCPELHENKEENTLTLSTARGDRLEALDEELKDNYQPTGSATKNKIIKF